MKEADRQRPKTDILNLDCELEPSELIAFSKSLGGWGAERRELELELKKIKADFKAKIDDIEKNINHAGQCCLTGKERRPITCDIEYNFEGNIMTFKRQDTKEVARQSQIPNDIRQEEMDFQAQRGEKPELELHNDEGEGDNNPDESDSE